MVWIRHDVDRIIRTVQFFLEYSQRKRDLGTYLVEAGPGRNPEAGACPGAGRTAGYGPVLGLNGVVGAATVGTLGFVDAMN